MTEQAVAVADISFWHLNRRWRFTYSCAVAVGIKVHAVMHVYTAAYFVYVLRVYILGQCMTTRYDAG